MAMSPGTIVGGYRIERVLGAGGMGTVYLAKHPSLPRMDAIKILGGELSSNGEFRGRFEREANLAAGLDHPNIVSVYNRGEENGQLWIAMQYVEGTDASAELARDPHAMTPLRALRIVTEVGKGL
ncbi:protein kinase domain-containing protein, partial [Nocardia wallacei]